MQRYNDHVSVTIDWISVTFSYASIFAISESMGTENVAAAIKAWLNLEANPELGKGAYNYAYSATFSDGVVLYWGGTASMGVHVQIHGQFLQKMTSPIGLVADILSKNGKITRIDLAIDTTEVSCASDIYRAYERGELKTRAQNVMRIESLSGATVYVGSRYSDRYLRVYDKGKQLNAGIVWTRIELEVKGSKANLYARVLVNEGLGAIPVLVRAFADAPHVQWYYNATRVTNPIIGIPKVNKMRDTQAWLLDVAIPCLIREMRNDPIFKSRVIKTLSASLDKADIQGLVDIEELA